MRIVFMGTPEFAVPSLQALVSSGYDIVAVYTQPDRPAGRGRHLVAPPVKHVAIELGLAVSQPASLRPTEEVERLAALSPDVIVVAAFGQLLRPNVISIPPHGILNVHASLLPRWRGASPISAAILAGDEETGVTIMQIDPGLDTGPMIAKATIPIAADDTTGSLTSKLAEQGARLLIDTLPGWLTGTLVAEPQDDSLTTIAPRLKPEDGVVDWSQTATRIDRQVRAMQPWPGASTTWNGKRIVILAATPEPADSQAEPGTVLAVGRSGLAVATGSGLLRIDRLQLEGSRAMDAAAFRSGQRTFVGSRLAT